MIPFSVAKELAFAINELGVLAETDPALSLTLRPTIDRLVNLYLLDSKESA